MYNFLLYGSKIRKKLNLQLKQVPKSVLLQNTLQNIHKIAATTVPAADIDLKATSLGHYNLKAQEEE